MLDLLAELSGMYIFCLIHFLSVYLVYLHVFFIFSLTACTVSWYHNNVELKQSVKYMKRYIGDDYTFIINRVKVRKRRKKLYLCQLFFLTFPNFL